MKINSVFIVLLKFSDNRSQASQFVDGHNDWIKQGFIDNVFLLVGSLKPNLGGGILVHNASLSDIQSRVKNDPFVIENVVKSEILEITPSKINDQLNFLFG